MITMLVCILDMGLHILRGPLTFGQKEESMFLGRSFGARREISDEMTMEMLLPNMVVLEAGSRS